MRSDGRTPATTPAVPTAEAAEATFPFIPLSSLTRLSIVYAHSVATMSQRLAQAKKRTKGNGTAPSLASLRRLVEDDKLQRGRLAHINQTMAAIIQCSVTQWSPEVLAYHLTALDARLFARVDLDALATALGPVSTPSPTGRDGTAHLPDYPAAVMPCLHLYDYVYHAWAHELIAALVPTSSPANGTPGRDVGPATQFARVAYHLLEVADVALHTFRNLNLAVAVANLFRSPEVRCVLDYGPPVPPALHAKIDQSIHTVFGDGSGEDGAAYRTALLKALGSPYQTPVRAPASPSPAAAAVDPLRDGGVVRSVYAVPCLTYHLACLRLLPQAFAATKAGAETDAGRSLPTQLGELGEAKFRAELDVLRACQTEREAFTSLGLAFPTLQRDTGARSAHPRSLDPSQRPGLDLAELVDRDLSVHHWLLTRPYLTRAQLREEVFTLLPHLPPGTFPVPTNPTEEVPARIGTSQSIVQPKRNHHEALQTLESPSSEPPVAATPTAGQVPSSPPSTEPVSQTELSQTATAATTTGEESDWSSFQAYDYEQGPPKREPSPTPSLQDFMAYLDNHLSVQEDPADMVSEETTALQEEGVEAAVTEAKEPRENQAAALAAEIPEASQVSTAESAVSGGNATSKKPVEEPCPAPVSTPQEVPVAKATEAIPGIDGEATKVDMDKIPVEEGTLIPAELLTDPDDKPNPALCKASPSPLTQGEQTTDEANRVEQGTGTPVAPVEEETDTLEAELKAPVNGSASHLSPQGALQAAIVTTLPEDDEEFVYDPMVLNEPAPTEKANPPQSPPVEAAHAIPTVEPQSEPPLLVTQATGPNKAPSTLVHAQTAALRGRSDTVESGRLELTVSFHDLLSAQDGGTNSSGAWYEDDDNRAEAGAVVGSKAERPKGEPSDGDDTVETDYSSSYLDDDDDDDGEEMTITFADLSDRTPSPMLPYSQEKTQPAKDL
ncbi:hypothetical protein IWQ60_008758 [Tieghemiomyces parasiticus]|uniref:Uncharacterized protein n=1 Tax=Tieghemiomyces parasiticus TaxID=78921 RepID=A0A9W7ZWD1_9FUNG|nr:hypothetical protein IWQ60_008758 [Tieghemiomyces parasiticus]